MCFQLIKTNATDANNNLGKQYIDVCERTNIIVSLLVQRLSAISKTRQENAQRRLRENPYVRDPEAQVREIPPLNISYFPHNWEKTIGAFFPIFISTDVEMSWQQFAWFLASMNDAGFDRKALYELLRTLTEAATGNDRLTPEQRCAFTTYAKQMVAGYAPIRVKRRSVPLPRRVRQRLEEWQSKYQPPPDLPRDKILNGISYPVRPIVRTEVDWWMQRRTIIVPKDGETAVMLLKLRDMDLWNFASTWNEIKSTNNCWQNIFVTGVVSSEFEELIQRRRYKFGEPSITWIDSKPSLS
jgi:hypothetical protein